ncbi:hypothetical protein [Chromobacterium sinusclupearum]|uniref:hypothetical protein n=1 Tax=Chromobacterium sinusclupearum TaxID=2077146 RepID=UPI0018EA6DED|nr:hypothetical protein [Chromobacterium sinusclupearum]
MTEPRTQPAFQVAVIAYRQTETPFVAAGASLAEAAAELGRRAGAEAARHAADGGVDDYVLTSTVLSPFLTDDTVEAEAFRHGMRKGFGREPDWITNAYECTGWGYILRHALRKARLSGPRRLLLQIVDVDIHNFAFWRLTSRWGHSGFGIATLLLDIFPDGDDEALLLGTAPQTHALTMMGRALRQFTEPRPGMAVALPFFPEATRRALFKSFDAAAAHPDRYSRFGHAFGSDPWLSMLAEIEAGADYAGGRCVLASLALNGYFAIAELAFAPDLRHALEAA